MVFIIISPSVSESIDNFLLAEKSFKASLLPFSSLFFSVHLKALGILYQAMGREKDGSQCQSSIEEDFKDLSEKVLYLTDAVSKIHKLLPSTNDMCWYVENKLGLASEAFDIVKSAIP